MDLQFFNYNKQEVTMYVKIKEATPFLQTALQSGLPEIEQLLMESDYRITNTVILIYCIGRRFEMLHRRKPFKHPDRVLATEAACTGLSGAEEHKESVLYITGKNDLKQKLRYGMGLCGIPLTH